MSEGFNKKGKCKLCKMRRTDAGHDPCIANLPGVVFACCGHGLTEGYMKFEDGRSIHFKPLRVILDEAQHEIVRAPIPVFKEGDPYRELDYNTGKTKGKVGRYPVTAIRDQSVTVRKRDRSTERR